MLAAMTGAMLGIMGLFDAGALTGEATQDRAALDDAATKTSISLTAITRVNNQFTAYTFTNTGNTKLWDYSHFTFVVKYDPNGGGNNPTTKVLTYGGISIGVNPTVDNTWVIYAFDPNDANNDPRVVNPGETFTVRARFNPTTEGNGANETVATMSTNNGATATRGATI
jgi:hypothetical protein